MQTEINYKKLCKKNFAFLFVCWCLSNKKRLNRSGKKFLWASQTPGRFIDDQVFKKELTLFMDIQNFQKFNKNLLYTIEGGK